MKGILADINIQGQARILGHILEGAYWGGLWKDLGLSLLFFRDVGLDPNAPDSAVWRLCQERELALLTANRNDDGPDSLEATIRAHLTPQSLPVFTLGDAEQVRHSREYAERAVEKLLGMLIEIDNLRGTGRLYLP